MIQGEPFKVPEGSGVSDLPPLQDGPVEYKSGVSEAVVIENLPPCVMESLKGTPSEDLNETLDAFAVHLRRYVRLHYYIKGALDDRPELKAALKSLLAD